MRDFKNKGEIVMVVMVFIAIFVGVFAAMANLLIIQGKVQSDKESLSSAFEIAESGMGYYRWFLSHFPTDMTDGTGHSGPYEHEYVDASGQPVGKFSLEVSGNLVCGKINSVDITSTGWTYDNPSLKKVVYSRYAQPSVAQYAYILDTDVWAGSDRVINGPYYSNGGIRMDGTNDSSVSSKLSTWNCTPAFGCSNPFQVKNGVFGAGSGSALWAYPSPWINFANILSSFKELRDIATSTGLYFGPSALGGGNNGAGRGYGYGNTGDKGWHITFKSDGSVDMQRVRNVTTVWGMDPNNNWVQEGAIIKNETSRGNHTLSSSCGVIFVEDNVWIEGTVKGKITLVVANIDAVSGAHRSAVIRGNINYATSDGTDGLTVIAEKNVEIPLDSPDTLSVHGIFVAQSGYFGRNYYFYSARDSKSVPNSYKDYVKRARMDIYGSVVSEMRVGTKWIDEDNNWLSGYGVRVDTYDRQLAKDPPPLTPFTSPDYQFIRWNEIK